VVLHFPTGALAAEPLVLHAEAVVLHAEVLALRAEVLALALLLVLRRFCSPKTGLLSPDKRGRYGGVNESIEPRGV